MIKKCVKQSIKTIDFKAKKGLKSLTSPALKRALNLYGKSGQFTRRKP